MTTAANEAAGATADAVAFPGEVVSITKAARLAGVSRRTIYHWMTSGKLTIYRTPSGLVRLVRSELLVREAT